MSTLSSVLYISTQSKILKLVLFTSGHKARGAAFHLLVQNTAAYFTQEHDVTDRRNIDAGRQQVDGYHNIGQPLFIEAGDHGLHFVRVFIGITNYLDPVGSR